MIQFRDAKRAADARELKAVAKKWARNVVLFVVGVFVLLFAYGSYIKYDAAQRTPEAVARIHARTVTMEMVEGKNLPPMPPSNEKDATVAGVDVNQNGVRDDVEIEIFKRHPTEPKVRAAQLQYAMALQSQLTEVFSKGTLDAAISEWLRARSCIDNLHTVDYSFLHDTDVDEWTEGQMNLGNTLSSQHDDLIEVYYKEVESLVVNTESRNSYKEKMLRQFDGGDANYKSGKENLDCDIQV